MFVDGTVVSVALPAIGDDLGATLAEQQWTVEAFLLMLGSLVLVGGSIGDVHGRRLVFGIGVAGFGAASLLCAVAPSAEALIAARAAQGLTAALLVPSSLAIITATYEGVARGRAIGIWTAGTSAAIAAGPPIGGLLIELASWRWIFLVNIPFVIAALAITWTAMPSLPGDRSRSVDVLGGALCALGLAGPVYALIEQPSRGWSDPLVLGAFVGGVIVLAAFLVHERRARDPMLPLALFRSRRFSVANGATLGVYAGLGSALFFLALFLQQVGGYSALEGGAALLPISLMLIALSSRFGALTERLGPRPLMSAGPLVASAGLLLGLRIDASPQYISEVFPAVAVFGLGLAMTVTPLTTTVLEGAPPGLAGTASGVNNAIARVAGLLAIAVVGALVAGAFAGELDSRLSGTRLDGPARTAIADAKARTLDPVPVPLQSRVAAQVEAAQADAAVIALHRGMFVSALLVAAGGLVSLALLPRGAREPS